MKEIKEEEQKYYWFEKAMDYMGYVDHNALDMLSNAANAIKAAEEYEEYIEENDSIELSHNADRWFGELRYYAERLDYLLDWIEEDAETYCNYYDVDNTEDKEDKPDDEFGDDDYLMDKLKKYEYNGFQRGYHDWFVHNLICIIENNVEEITSDINRILDDLKEEEAA